MATKRQKLVRKILALSEQGLSQVAIDKKLGWGKGRANYYMRHYGALVNGTKPNHRQVRPIVLDMAKEEAEQTTRMSSVLDLAWSKLGFEEKLRAIETL